VLLVPVVFWRLLTAIRALAVIPSRSFSRVRMRGDKVWRSLCSLIRAAASSPDRSRCGVALIWGRGLRRVDWAIARSSTVGTNVTEPNPG